MSDHRPHPPANDATRWDRTAGNVYERRRTLLTIDEAAARLGLTRAQFKNRQRDGWPERHGQRLPFTEEPIGRGNRPRQLFSADDVGRLAQMRQESGGLAPGWIDEGTFRDAMGDWHTAAQGA